MQAHRDMIYVEEDPASLLDRFAGHSSVVGTKSFDRIRVIDAGQDRRYRRGFQVP